MTGTPRCRIFSLRGLWQRMNSSVRREVAEPLEEIDRMSPSLLVEPVDRLRQALLGRVEAVMAHLLFECLPRPLLRVLLGRVLREADHSNPRLPFQIVFNFLVREVRRRVE